MDTELIIAITVVVIIILCNIFPEKIDEILEGPIAKVNKFKILNLGLDWDEFRAMVAEMKNDDMTLLELFASNYKMTAKELLEAFGVENIAQLKKALKLENSNIFDKFSRKLSRTSKIETMLEEIENLKSEYFKINFHNLYLNMFYNLFVLDMTQLKSFSKIGLIALNAYFEGDEEKFRRIMKYYPNKEEFPDEYKYENVEYIPKGTKLREIFTNTSERLKYIKANQQTMPDIIIKTITARLTERGYMVNSNYKTVEDYFENEIKPLLE